MEVNSQHNQDEQTVDQKAVALKKSISKLVAERDSLYFKWKESQAQLEQLRKSYRQLDEKRKEVRSRLEKLYNQLPPR